MAANPIDTHPLRLDQEIRDIEEGLQRAKLRDNFDIQKKLAVRSRDFRRAIMEYEPNILHFCGHGSSDGKLVLENDSGETQLHTPESLSQLLGLFADHIECVLITACYSEAQAQEIVKYIDYVIGMRESIGDKAAIEFSVAFYDALGAGKSYDFAYEYACSAIVNLNENLTPNIKKKNN